MGITIQDDIKAQAATALAQRVGSDVFSEQAAQQVIAYEKSALTNIGTNVGTEVALKHGGKIAQPVLQKAGSVAAPVINPVVTTVKPTLDAVRDVGAGAVGAVKDAGGVAVETVKDVGGKVASKVGSLVGKKAAVEVTEVAAEKGTQALVQTAAVQTGEAVLEQLPKEALKQAPKEGFKIFGKSLGQVIPFVGAFIGIGFDTVEFKGELDKIDKYCKKAGLSFDLPTVLVNEEVRGAVIEKGGQYALNLGIDIASAVIGVAWPLGVAASFILSVGAKGLFIYKDIADPDAVQLANQLQEQLDDPNGNIQLSSVRRAIVKMAEARDPALGAKLKKMEAHEDPALNQITLTVAEAMAYNGNAAGTLNYLASEGELKAAVERAAERFPPVLAPMDHLLPTIGAAAIGGVGLAVAGLFAPVTLPIILGGAALMAVGGFTLSGGTKEVIDTVAWNMKPRTKDVPQVAKEPAPALERVQTDVVPLSPPPMQEMPAAEMAPEAPNLSSEEQERARIAALVEQAGKMERYDVAEADQVAPSADPAARAAGFSKSNVPTV